MELSKKDFQCEMPDFQIGAQSDPILGPKVPYFVPGGVTQLMIPPLDLNRSTLVPATKARDHHAPQGPQGLKTPDLLCINCPCQLVQYREQTFTQPQIPGNAFGKSLWRESRRLVHCWGSSHHAS